MRYGVAHRAETRERILRAAADQFRARGAEAVRVSDVMSAAGLTHGGFYHHFRDKDQLLSEAIAFALADVARNVSAMTEGRSRETALKAVIEFYLSESHVEHPELGCALAAMGTEMARLPRKMRVAVGKALNAYAESLDHLMPGATAPDRRAAFLVLFPSMAGCIMTARTYADASQRARVLAAGRAFFTNGFCGTLTRSSS